MEFYFLYFEETKLLFDIFNRYNIDARFVGGCVRDAICNIITDDFDIAVNCDILKLCNILSNHNIKIIKTGIKFSSITAIINTRKYEITSLREDINCSGRHCDTQSTSSFEIDSKRRDFTINALYVSQYGELFDYNNGLNDLQNNRIIFIGDPQTRIKEDFLRIFRYYRFCSKYNDYSNRYSKIIKQESSNTNIISIERIQKELFKTIEMSNNSIILNNMLNDDILHDINIENYDNLLKIHNQKIKNIIQNQFYMNKKNNIQSEKLNNDSYNNFTQDNNSSNIKLALKLYILFQYDYLIDTFKLPKTLRNIIKIYKQFENEPIIYCAYKNNIDIQQDIITIQHIKHNKPLLEPIVNIQDKKFPVIYSDLPTGIKQASKYLKECERWWVINNFNPTKQKCIEHILSVLSQ